MSKQIEVKTTIKNGSLVTAANADKITVIGKKGEYHGFILDTSVDTENYTPRYKIVKEEDGWIAREVTFNHGICGHADTLREQIIRIGSGKRYKIVVED